MENGLETALVCLQAVINLFQKSLCNEMSHVVLFAYPIKLNISTRNIVMKVLPKTFVGFTFNDLGKLQMTNFILTKFAIIIQFGTRRFTHSSGMQINKEL